MNPNRAVQVKPGAAPVGIVQFMQGLNREIAQLLAAGAHADVIVTVRNGTIELVRVNRSWLPADVAR